MIATPLISVTVALITTPFCGLLVGPAIKLTEALPEISVIAVAALRLPPLGSVVIVKFMRAFLTRLLAASRTTAEIVAVLFIEPVLGWIVLGLAWTVTLLAVVATNSMFKVAAGVLPGPAAVIMADPAEVEEMDMLAVPVPSVVAGLPVMMPRLVEKLTDEPITGCAELVQLMETVVGVDRLISGTVAGATGSGAVKAKLALLMVSV